jgi:hypothetical protein
MIRGACLTHHRAREEVHRLALEPTVGDDGRVVGGGVPAGVVVAAAATRAILLPAERGGRPAARCCVKSQRDTAK